MRTQVHSVLARPLSKLKLTDSALLAAVLVMHSVVGLLVFRFGTVLQDEGLLYVWAQRLLDGQLPYTDFYLVQAPGTFYVHALLIELFGVSFGIGRAFKQLQGLGVLWLAYAIVRRATGSGRAGLVAATACATFSAALHVRYPWYSTDACLCLLAAMWAACLAIESERASWSFASGIALGAAVLFKQNHGVFGAVAIGCVFAVYAFRTRPAGPAHAVMRAAKLLSPLALGAIASVGAYLAYYAAAGGSLRLLWLNTFVWASEAKGYTSVIDSLLMPIEVFTLISKRTWIFPAGALGLIAGLVVALCSRVSVPLRWLGGALALAMVALGSEIFVRVYIWSFGSALVFAIAVASLVEAHATRDPARQPRAYTAALVSLVAAANLYGGTIPGGGWGRLVETLPATLPAFGVCAWLLRRDDPGPVSRAWKRFVWATPTAVGMALLVSALAVSAGLLYKNQAFRPRLDVELQAMTGEARAPGWVGLRGDPIYVADTDAVLSSLRERTVEERRSVHVFPLNPALYPLADARNPTSYDNYQSDFIAPSRFADAVAQLERAKPALVVMQRHANPSLGPDFDDREIWVELSLRESVEAYVHGHYRLIRSWTYYELWEKRPPG